MTNTKFFEVQYFDKIRSKWISSKSVKPQKTLKDSIKKATTIIKNIERRNKNAETDWRSNSYGTSEMPIFRIVEYVNGKHIAVHFVDSKSKKETVSNDYYKRIFMAEKNIDLKYLVREYMNSM